MRDCQRYRIDRKTPGGNWETFWDAMAFDKRQALESIRDLPGVKESRKQGCKFRAVPEAGKLFGT